MTTNPDVPEAPTSDVEDPDYPIDPVPAHARKSLFSLSIVLLGFTFFTPTMLAGAEVGAAFAFGDLIWVLLLGSAVLGVYVAVIGAIGARTGLTTVLMSRYTLGDRGSKLASLLLGGTQIGWYGVTVAVLGELTAQAIGWDSTLGERTLMVIGGIVMGITAYYGYKGMYALSVVSVPLLVVLIVFVVYRSLDEVGGWSGLADQEPGTTMSVAAAVTIIVGTFASGGTQAPNWTRFARTPAAAFVAALVAFLVGELLMLFCGAIGAVAFGEPDFVVVLFNLGLVTMGVLFLIANLWTTNDNTAYNFGVAGAEIFNSRTKKPFVVAGVVIGTLLAITGIYDNLTSYLAWLGVLIPPLGGVIIGDYVARWRRGLPAPSEHPFVAVHWPNLGAYALGALAAWWSGEVGFGIPPVNGIVVSVLLVMVTARLMDRPART